MAALPPHPARVTNRPVQIHELVVRPEPKLADIATALQTLHKDIQALSQQLDHLGHDTLNSVINYIKQCTKYVSDDLTANFGEIRADRQWIHLAILRHSHPLDALFYTPIDPGSMPASLGVGQATSRLPIQNLALPREPKLADIMRAVDALHKNIQALSQQISRLEQDLIHTINDFIYKCTKFIGLNNLNPNFEQMTFDRIFLHAIFMMDNGGNVYFGNLPGMMYANAGEIYTSSFAKRLYTPIDA